MLDVLAQTIQESYNLFLLTPSLKTKMLVFFGCFSSTTKYFAQDVWRSAVIYSDVFFPAASEDGVVACTSEILVFSRSFHS